MYTINRQSLLARKVAETSEIDCDDLSFPVYEVRKTWTLRMSPARKLFAKEGISGAN